MVAWERDGGGRDGGGQGELFWLGGANVLSGLVKMSLGSSDGIGGVFRQEFGTDTRDGGEIILLECLAESGMGW